MTIRTSNEVNNIFSFTGKCDIRTTKDKVIVKCTTFKGVNRFKMAAGETASSIATSECAGNDVIRVYPFIKGFLKIFTVSSKSLM